MQPAVFVNGLCRSFRHFIIPLHDGISSYYDFAGRIGRQLLIRFRIYDLDFYERHFPANRRDPLFNGITYVCHGTHGRDFCQAIRDCNFSHIHQIYDLFHDFYWTRGSRHNAGTQGRKVIFGKVGMFQHCDIHRRDAIRCRTALPLDRIHDSYRVITFYGHDRRTVRDTCHNSEYAAEAVEKRHRQANSVSISKDLIITDAFSVIQYIIMCQHDAFRKPCGAGSILHIDNVMAIYGSLACPEFVIRYFLGQFMKL